MESETKEKQKGALWWFAKKLHSAEETKKGTLLTLQGLQTMTFSPRLASNRRASALEARILTTGGEKEHSCENWNMRINSVVFRKKREKNSRGNIGEHFL